MSLPSFSVTPTVLFPDDSSLPAHSTSRPSKKPRVAEGSEVLISLFQSAMQKQGTIIGQNEWKPCLSGLDYEETLKVTKFLFENPSALSHMEIGKAQKLSIKPWGGSYHSFAEFPRIFMENVGKEEERVSLFLDDLSKKIHALFKEKSSVVEKRDALPSFDVAKAKVLGRTVVIQDPEDPEFLLAHKFKRANENIDEFCREATITELYKKSGCFRSTLPDPVGVYSLKQIDERILKLLPEGVDTESPTVYVQKTKPSYYTYLHEIEDEQEWEEARKKFLIDSGLQIRSGQVPPFADLYHNAEGSRRYQPLINLIPTYDKGAGRLEKAFTKIMYPNAGADGTRDVGDGDLIVDLIKEPWNETMDLFKFRSNKMPYMLMNAVAKLSFVDTIMLAYRLDKLGRIDWENDAFIAKIAKDLKEGQKWILEGFLNCDPKSADEFVEALPIDWERQAKQLMFWLQTDERGYPGYLEKGTLPPGLYDDEMEIEIDLKKAQNYYSGKGFYSDGEKDIGCYNGPLGFVEFEERLNITSAIAVGYYLDQFATIAPRAVDPIEEPAPFPPFTLWSNIP